MSEESIVFYIYENRLPGRFKRYPCKEKKTVNNYTYFHVTVPVSDRKKLERFLKRRNLSYKCYERNWERSSGYRERYFASIKPPYRCRYCNRKLKKENATVDHIVPVALVKNSEKARKRLLNKGITNVNDPDNLCISCFECNQRKGERLGIWYYRAQWGRNPAYWTIKRLLKILLIGAIVIVIYLFATGHFEQLTNFVKDSLSNLSTGQVFH